MNLGPLRAQALALNLAVHGVDVTITPAPDGATLTTRGLWLTPTTPDVPTGAVLARRQPIRIMAFSRAAVPSVAVGSVVLAPEYGRDEVLQWRVDGVDLQEADHTRVMLTPAPDET